MSYEIVILRRAQKILNGLPKKDYQRVRDAIRALANEPRPVNCLKLTGREAWRIRIGDYRVIYEINDTEQIVSVLDIGHRRDIYR